MEEVKTSEDNQTTVDDEKDNQVLEGQESNLAENDEESEEAEREKLRREREARAQALTLEIVGDLPYAEVKPPENVLFVCKLNPVTEDEDLHTIFSRFGSILSCEVIRDKRTGDSLQYAFIEYENQKDCEQAYFKMSGVLIDDHRIHVDFSQSVSRLADVWRTKTNSKRRQHGGGFGGVASLEKKRQYRKIDPREASQQKNDGYGMVFDKKDVSQQEKSRHSQSSKHDRSQSPQPDKDYRRPRPSTDRSHERRLSRDRWRRHRYASPSRELSSELRDNRGNNTRRLEKGAQKAEYDDDRRYGRHDRGYHSSYDEDRKHRR